MLHERIVLLTMSNIPVSSNSTASLGLESLSTRLPNRWSLLPARKEPDFGNYRPDALVEVRAPDGSRGLLMVEAKSSVTAQQAANLATRLVAAARTRTGEHFRDQAFVRRTVDKRQRGERPDRPVPTGS